MSREIAEEALIENRARYHQTLATGPINVYQCNSCDCFHFTSKGEPHPMLLDSDTQARIKREKQGWDWESKFRGR